MIATGLFAEDVDSGSPQNGEGVGRWRYFHRCVLKCLVVLSDVYCHLSLGTNWVVLFASDVFPICVGNGILWDGKIISQQS